MDHYSSITVPPEVSMSQQVPGASEQAPGSCEQAPGSCEQAPGSYASQEEANCKWYGGVQLVIQAPVGRAWEIASSTCDLPVWMPMIESCEMVEGVGGVKRRIRGDILPRIDGIQSWAVERLVDFDEERHYYSYTVEQSNIGMEGYTATFQLHDFGDGTTLVSWFYEVDPMPDTSQELMAEYMSMFFKACANKLERVACHVNMPRE